MVVPTILNVNLLRGISLNKLSLLLRNKPKGSVDKTVVTN